MANWTHGMSDEADKANDEVQKQLEATLKSVNTEVPENESGKCLWCEKTLSDKRRWCSPICRNEHEYYASKL